MLALPRGRNKAAPTTPLLNLIIAYAVREVKMRAAPGRRPAGKLTLARLGKRCYTFIAVLILCGPRNRYARQDTAGRKPADMAGNHICIRTVCMKMG